MQRRSGSSFQIYQRTLARGQSLFEKMPRGTVIHIAVGTAVLVQRIPLEHATLVQHTAMARGAVRGVQVSGWLEIVAQSDAELVLQVPQSVSLRPLARALMAWLARALPRWAVRPASAVPPPEMRRGATAAVAHPPDACSPAWP